MVGLKSLILLSSIFIGACAPKNHLYKGTYLVHYKIGVIQLWMSGMPGMQIVSCISAA